MRPGGISRRSPNTCAECRARKVKCDGSRNDRNNGCTGCKRLKLDCSFSRVGAQVDGTVVPDVSLESRKKKIACTNCRSLKAKCDGELPSCTRCLRKRRSCLYPSSRNIERETNTVSDASVNTHKDQITAQEPSDTQSVLPSLDKSFVLRMIEAFFQHIHPIPVYSYLHKASLVQRFESGQLDHALLLALASTTCELLDMGADLTAQSVDWMSHVERSMMKEYCRPSVIKIQISVMLINHCIRQGRLSNAFMLHAVASRGAFALGLNHEAPKFGFLARESRRRLMWALYIIDTRLAGGMSDFTLCSSASMRIQLPCHERNFEFDLPQDVEVLESAPGVPLSVSVGSLAIYMRLMWFRHRILQATKGAVLSETMSVGQLTTSIEQLAKELSTFETSLPQSLQLSSRSLQLRVHSSRLGPFLLVHVWLRQCYCDLYRIALTGLKEALPSIRLEQVEHSVVQTWRRNCFDSAMALAGIFRHFTNLKNSRPVIEHDIIACAYQCARLLLHITRCYAEVLHIDYFAVQENAQQCLAAVRTMQTRSLMGELITRDLAKLLQRGSSPSPQGVTANSEPRSNGTSAQEASSHPNHLFSRHSAIGQMQITDEDTDVDVRVAHAQQGSSTTTHTTENISNVATVSEPTDFNFSNAFEGAFEDLDLSLHDMYWNPTFGPLDATNNNQYFEMTTWNA